MSEDPNKKQKRYFTISLFLHLGVFLLMAAGGLIFPQKADLQLPTVQIDMVALPDQVKQEPAPVDTSLPAKEEAPPPPEPVAIAVPEKKKEPKKEPKKDTQKQAKNALERLREQLETERKEEERKKREALDQRRADLERLKEKAEIARAALRGNQKNVGTSATGAMQSTMNAYFAHVNERLKQNWALPAWLQSQGLSAVVRIYLDGRGNVVRMTLVKASGSEVFDNYVKGAVQSSSPFAPPPEEMSGGLRNSGIEVGFPL